MSFSGHELNIDGIVGPSHSYGGLSWGNKPSFAHQGIPGNPRRAALQGLAKMKMVMDLGIPQAFFPPHERPYLPLLRQLGFEGTLTHMFNEAKRKMAWIFPYLYSSSSMWAANAATMTPSIDSVKKKAQFTPANLQTHLHRSQETEFTARLLNKMFPNPIFFDHYPPLPATPLFSDEGAANSMRLAKTASGPGVHLFVFGESRTNEKPPGAWQSFRPRQSKEASEAIAYQHGIYEKQLVFAEQSSASIELGAFHNDLISTANHSLFLIHEEAFNNQAQVLDELSEKIHDYADSTLNAIVINKEKLSLEEAIDTFFFNGQILTTPDGSMTWLAPTECLNSIRARKLIDEIVQDGKNPISQVHYLNLTESMQNGGGPGCLRLRVLLNENEFAEMDRRFLLDAQKLQKITDWVKKWYRDHLSPQDLFDPKFALECQEALHELTQILSLGPIYPFQGGR